MRGEIIAVGNEIVTGNTVNSNASYIAKQIQTLGIMPKYHSAVRDNREDLYEALHNSLKRADVIFVTGGLGPTEDDLTKEVICSYLGLELVIREEIYEEIKSFFKKLGRYMPEGNKKQAAFPPEAYILENKNGTAPGCILTKESQFIVLLPGPPKEMQPMLDHYVLPYFRQQMNACYHTLDIKLFGIGESEMAEKIAHLLGEFEKVNVAPYIGNYEVIVRVTAYGQDKEEAVRTAEKIKNEVGYCLGEYIIGYNQDTLENIILELMKKHHCTFATAESCTGGLLASCLVNCSGVSEHFKEGFITYSNAAKTKHLGVSEETLKQYGAVSRQTAIEMAEGVKLRTQADIGLSATGIAGPGGGTDEKPVGLVYIGMALPDKTEVYELHLNGDRQAIREKTVKNILFQLYRSLK